MSDYQARISNTADGDVYAMVVRVDRDGEQQVDATFRARHFATRAKAERAIAKHLSK